MDFRHIKSDWAGLPGFFVALPTSAIVVQIGLLPALAGRFGYEVKPDFGDKDFEYGFVVCAFLNAFIFYPVYYAIATRRRRPR